MRQFMVTLLVIVHVVSLFAACSKPSPKAEVKELRHFPLDSMDGLITRSGVEMDQAISSDGHGSLKITATERTVVRLFDVSGILIDDARLIYQARVRTEDVKGLVYLKMWCYFKGKGEFYSQSIQSPLSGTNEWTTLQTPFYLRAGERPNEVKLQLVIDGSGTVWIDDVRLIKGPPPPVT
jgi:hypothetical protein